VNSLYAYSHKPDEHEEWSKNKEIFYYRKGKLSSDPKSSNVKSSNSKTSDTRAVSKLELVMVDKLRTILAIANPNFTVEEIERFIQVSPLESN